MNVFVVADKGKENPLKFSSYAEIGEEEYGYDVQLSIDHGQYVDGQQLQHSSTFSSKALAAGIQSMHWLP